MWKYSAGENYLRVHEEKIRAVRSTILSHPTVQDCFIASKLVGNGVVDIVAYVVADGSFDEAALADCARPHLPAVAQSLTLVTVGSLPPAPEIADFDAAGVAVLDDELVNSWQRTVDSSFGPGRLQVGIAAAGGSQGTIQIVNETRSKILQEMVVDPDHLIPVGRTDIPKTGLGKIQHSKLAEQYVCKLLGWSEPAAGTERSTELPAWFYRPVWSPSTVRRLPGQESGSVLVFLDRLGLGDALCSILRGRGQSCVSVHQEAGAPFQRVATDAFVIDPDNGNHYHLLVRAITDQGARPDHLLHLSDYAAHVQFSDTQTIRDACRAGAGWLVHVLTAMDAAAWDSPVSLRVVGACTQRIAETDRVTFTRAPLRNLLKTAAQEIPWLRCHHLDLEIGEHDNNAQRIVDEIDDNTADPDAAYRAGRRLVPRLAPVHRADETLHVPQFATGGLYVLTGGVGGIGIEIARHLLIHHDAKVLLLGRSRLHGSDPTSGLSTGAKVALKKLRTLSADVRYAVADVTDEQRVRTCIEQAEEHWKTRVAAVVHLANHYTEQSLLECSADQLLAAMEPKICGAWTLHKILKDRPGTPLLLFSSATGYFGAALQGPHAAANAALDAFANHVHTEAAQAGATSGCRSIGWSVWHETGISQGMALSGQAPLQGYQMMVPHEALLSLSVAAADSHPFVLVGLDPSGRMTRRYMAGPPRLTRKIVARINEPEAVDRIARVLAPIRLLDRYGIPTSCEVVADDGDLPRVRRGAGGLRGRQAV